MFYIKLVPLNYYNFFNVKIQILFHSNKRMIFNWSRKLSYSRYLGLKKTKFPPRPLHLVDEKEIVENFIKGGGPGGQKINKTSSKVQLIHKPTGIVVSSQHSRSQSQNRQKARELLSLKLDDLKNGENSRNRIIQNYEKNKKRNKRKKSIRKYARLKELSETDKNIISIN